MTYPEDFQAEARRVYPDWTRLHELIEQGAEFVGRYLDDASSGLHLSVEDVLAAQSLETLQERARGIQAKQELYRRWLGLYMTQHRIA